MPQSNVSSAFRFSLTQLLLITTLCCLLLALAVALKDRVAGSYEPQLLEYSPDGEYVAAGFEGGLVRVWSIPEQDQIKRFGLEQCDRLVAVIGNLHIVLPLLFQ